MISPDCQRRKHGPGRVILLVLGALTTLAIPLSAQDTSASEPTPVPAGQPILLQYKEVDAQIESRSLRMSSQGQPFAKEPDLAGRKPVRGVFLFGTNKVNGLPFVWDQSRGKLYLDLNRNRDLTDDPKGVFTSRERATFSYYQDFRGIRASFETARGTQQACFDLNIHAGDGGRRFTIGTRSFWEGRVSLQNRDLQVGLVEDITTPGSTNEAYLLIRPWAERDRNFNLQDRPVAAVRLCPNLFYGKQAYMVQCGFVARESAAGVELQFNEHPADLGELKLSGQYLKRLVLAGAQSKVPWTVVLDEPEPVVRIPLGTYRFCQARLAHGQVEAAYDPPRYDGFSESPIVVVTGANPSTFEIGGPLTNAVSVQRNGRNLRFSYELTGAGGKAYQLTQTGRDKPPQYSVVKDGKQIASGNFQFG